MKVHTSFCLFAFPSLSLHVKIWLFSINFPFTCHLLSILVPSLMVPCVSVCVWIVFSWISRSNIDHTCAFPQIKVYIYFLLSLLYVYSCFSFFLFVSHSHSHIYKLLAYRVRITSVDVRQTIGMSYKLSRVSNERYLHQFDGARMRGCDWASTVLNNEY